MRLLVVSAHTADFCSRAGGAHRATRESGRRGEGGDAHLRGAVRVPGACTPVARPALDAVKTVRREEAERAAAALGAEIAFCDSATSASTTRPSGWRN